METKLKTMDNHPRHKVDTFLNKDKEAQKLYMTSAMFNSIMQSIMHGRDKLTLFKQMEVAYKDLMSKHRELITINPEKIIVKLPESQNLEKGQWQWMMDFCKKNGLAPADSWNWNQAYLAYQIPHKNGE